MLTRTYNNEGFRFLDDLTSLGNFFFSLEKIMTFDDNRVYVIKYESSYNGNIQEWGRLFINTQDYGIVKMEYNNGAVTTEKSKGEAQIFYNGKVYKKTEVYYRKIDNKYFLNLIKWMAPVRGAWEVTDDSSSHLQFFTCTLYVNNIYSSSKEYVRIKKRNAESPHVDLYNHTYKYDSNFWNGFNYVKIDPLVQKAKNDLQKIKSLDEQYNKQ